MGNSAAERCRSSHVTYPYLQARQDPQLLKFLLVSHILHMQAGQVQYKLSITCINLAHNLVHLVPIISLSATCTRYCNLPTSHTYHNYIHAQSHPYHTGPYYSQQRNATRHTQCRTCTTLTPVLSFQLAVKAIVDLQTGFNQVACGCFLFLINLPILPLLPSYYHYYSLSLPSPSAAYQTGLVSLFIVIFSKILYLIITT